MLRPTRRAALAAALSALAGPALAADFAYDGWRIDTGAAPEPLAPELEASLRAQFDIVKSLDGRIRPDVYAFFRGLPLFLVPASRGGAGDYQFGSHRLQIAAKLDPPQNPVLLHEMLHAFHDQRLGRYDPRLRELYARTVASGAFPAGSYMLKNPGEFFAMCASVELWGRAARAPFTRDELRAKAPEVAAWIDATFGFAA